MEILEHPIYRGRLGPDLVNDNAIVASQNDETVKVLCLLNKE